MELTAIATPFSNADKTTLETAGMPTTIGVQARFCVPDEPSVKGSLTELATLYSSLYGATWESKCDHNLLGGAMTAVAGVAAAVTTLFVASF